LKLPCDSNEACHFYRLVVTQTQVPGKKVVVVLDEIEKIENPEVIGWICKILDEHLDLVIGITNAPAYVKSHALRQSLWRRFAAPNGVLIYAPPANLEERIHICHAAARKLKRKISRDEAKKMAEILEGYNFLEVLSLFQRSCKLYREISYDHILELVQKRAVQPSNTPKDEERYLNDLHDIPVWDINQRLSLTQNRAPL
jgi:SpoVK/Ycf46/Vps4 family AAA+-type ATPase